MKKLLCSFLLISLLSMSWIVPALAHPDQNDHYIDIEKILFGKEILTKSERDSTTLTGDPAKDALISLEHAAAIVLDQYKGLYQDKLDRLREYGVQNLPPDTTTKMDEDPRGINFGASGHDHRSFTHRGWTFSYLPASSKANWPVRKEILLETAKAVFDAELLDDKRREAFCALIYYIHVLGDLLPDSKEKDGSITVHLIQPNASTRNPAENADIFLELDRYLSILFTNHGTTFSRMQKKIRNLRSEAIEISRRYNSFPDKNNPQAMNDYHDIAKRLYKILCVEINPMLQLEPFFNRVFLAR